MKKPKQLSLVLIYGPAGAGKTTLAEYLYNELESTAHIGVDHIKRFISLFRENPSYDGISRMVINAMCEQYLKTGISVIVEQGMVREQIEELERIANNTGAKFFVYRLDASQELTDKRASERHVFLGKPAIPKEILDNLYLKYKENDYPNTQAFDSEATSIEDMAQAILRQISA